MVRRSREEFDEDFLDAVAAVPDKRTINLHEIKYSFAFLNRSQKVSRWQMRKHANFSKSRDWEMACVGICTAMRPSKFRKLSDTLLLQITCVPA